MNVSRKELLGKLEVVSPGLSAKGSDHSNCFMFKGGRVYTFNDEVACSTSCAMDFEGTVPAEPLMDLLKKLTDDEIVLVVGDGDLRVKGKRKKYRSAIRLDKEALLPIEGIEESEDWKKVPENLIEAVRIVSTCSSSEDSQFILTCVHVHPEWVEACDDRQLARYPLKTGLEKDTLISANALKAIAGAGVIDFAVTENWMHFRSDNLMLSCRQYAMVYPDLGAFLEMKGTKTPLPEGLIDAVGRAEIFSSEERTFNQVFVTLKKDGMEVEGRGPSGWYQERWDLAYDGEETRFRISPKLLVEVARRSKECEIGDGKIKVDGGSFIYVGCTGEVK